MNDKQVELIKYPTSEDWLFCRECTLNTVGKHAISDYDMTGKVRLIESEHSPLRTLWFGFRLIIPYWVSTHFVRHKVGVEHFVQSQRNDRQSNYNRCEARQDEIVSHVIYLNAQALVSLCHARLCSQASAETRQVVEKMVEETLEKCPEFKSVLVPRCEYRNGLCTEFKPCGRNMWMLNKV